MKAATQLASHTKRNRFLMALLILLLLIATVAVFNQYRRSRETPIQLLAEDSSVHGHSVTAYGELTVTVIHESLSTAQNSGVYIDEIEEDCFSIQKAFWQKYHELTQVQVVIDGPMASGSVATFGQCTMDNGVNVAWDTLDFVQAWDSHIYTAQGFSHALS